MNPVKTIKQYIQKIVEDTAGLKIILFDDETCPIISSVYTMSALLNKEVFLVDKITNSQREKMSCFKCICVLRPTAVNVDELCEELKHPKYAEYHLYFTNSLKKSFIDRIADADMQELVTSFQEYYADFYGINDNFFSLGIESCFGSSLNTWKNDALKRAVEGMTALLTSFSKYPIVRFDKSSPMAYRFAEEVCDYLKQNQEAAEIKKDPVILLILDRRSDLATPLVTHWTYQSMLHENFDYKNGRVILRSPFKSADSENFGEMSSATAKEFCMMADEDRFLKNNLFGTFGELGANIKKYIEACKSERFIDSVGTSNIEEMKKFIEEYPEYKKVSSDLAKHVTIIEELNKIVHIKSLLSLSEVEQSIVTEAAGINSNFTNMKRLLPALDSKLCLKLLMLFYITYRDHAGYSHVQSELISLMTGYTSNDFLEAFFEFCEYERREPLQKSFSIADNILQKGKATVTNLKSSLQNMHPVVSGSPTIEAAQSVKNTVEYTNVYTQHKATYLDVVDSLVKGKLSTLQFPFFDSLHCRIPAACSKFIVFFVNGVTFEEARITSDHFPSSPKGAQVICGGTGLCNFDAILHNIHQIHEKKPNSISNFK